ncbi:MAG: YfhO family protein [Clostridia bacterium]|nr:YfhO family protein [Clostridia bacterium]
MKNVEDLGGDRMRKKIIQAIRQCSRWRKASYIGLFLFYSIILFAAYSKYYFADQFLVSGDGVTGLPNYMFLQNALSDGEIPLWNKYFQGGMPFTTSYSLTMLLSFLPVKLIHYVLYIGIVALGATCAFAYFKRIGCTNWASFAISICYLLCVHLGGIRKEHMSLICTAAMLPVILCLVERYFDERKLRWLLASSVAMAVQYIIGFQQMALYSDLFVGVYLIAYGFHYRMKISKMLSHGLLWGVTYLGLIIWKIVPVLEQTQVYIDGGATGSISYAYFTSFSIHPVKLLQMIFPEVFGGEIFYSFEILGSSGMDIEIFLGHMVFLLVLVGALHMIRNFRIRFALSTMLAVFLYAACGSIEPLARLLFQIPILNGFRVPSRILFIFFCSAFTISALVLSQMQEEAFRQKALQLMMRICGILLAVTAAAILGAGIVTGVQNGFTESGFSSLFSYLENDLLSDCAALLICLLICWLAYTPPRKLQKHLYREICAAVAVITLIETFPYSMMTTPISVSYVMPNTVSTELKQDLVDGIVWDAYNSIEASHQSIVSLNRSASKELPSINVYTALNNPRLCRMLAQSATSQLNSSGLLIGSARVSKNLYFQNALLSMLGVKYIIDSSGYLSGDQSIYTFSEDKTVITKTASGKSTVYPGNYSMYYETIYPNRNTYYEIEGCFYSDAAQSIYIDFLGTNEGFVYSGQTTYINLQKGENHLHVNIFSGETGNSSESGIYWRCVSPANIAFELKDVTMYEIHGEQEFGVYQYYSDGDGTPIYLNTKARDILYVPDQIKWIENEDDLYTFNMLYRLDRVNYSSTAEERTLNPDAVQITDVDFGYNQITAHISSAEDTFVNFSQCWYPGWRAYVNGKETPVQMVNGLIMGAEVPAGEVDLCFVYVPVKFFLGLGFSGAVCAALIAGYIFAKRKEKKLAAAGTVQNIDTCRTA